MLYWCAAEGNRGPLTCGEGVRYPISNCAPLEPAPLYTGDGPDLGLYSVLMIVGGPSIWLASTLYSLSADTSARRRAITHATNANTRSRMTTKFLRSCEMSVCLAWEEEAALTAYHRYGDFSPSGYPILAVLLATPVKYWWSEILSQRRLTDHDANTHSPTPTESPCPGKDSRVGSTHPPIQEGIRRRQIRGQCQNPNSYSKRAIYHRRGHQQSAHYPTRPDATPNVRIPLIIVDLPVSLPGNPSLIIFRRPKSRFVVQVVSFKLPVRAIQ